MLSKKHNELISWKSKLEALDSMPGASITGKDVLWDRLNSRLQQKPTGKKAVWYWIAAGILPLFIISFMMLNNAENNLVKQETGNGKNINAIPASLLPGSKESLMVYLSPPVKKMQRIAVGKIQIKNKTQVATVKITEPALSVKALPEQIETVSIKPNATSVDTFALTAVAEKKLQVVHINELETVPAAFTAPVNYARDLTGKAKKSKSGNLSISTRPNGIGFKIKLSSKN